MYLFFEEDGVFKAGTVLAQNGGAYQVELPTGKRTKVKGGHVFFPYEGVPPAELTAKAQDIAATIDPGFLWETLPDGEVRFEDVAREYFGEKASVVEKVGTLFAMHANPVYFHRKGRGVFRKAPEEILQSALAALKKKALLEEQKKAWVREMADEGRVPDEIAKNAVSLLTHPDKNAITYKALNDAASEMKCSPLDLLLKLKAIPSAYAWHMESFFEEYFPHGTQFSTKLPSPDVSAFDALPLASAEAFSIDSLETTEIDDAFSLEDLGDGRLKLGIHIAAPALAITRDSVMDEAARSRYSTVYAPGVKITMLPTAWGDAFSLVQGRSAPCLSLYAGIDKETFEVISSETRLERVRVAANLRTENIEGALTDEALDSFKVDTPFGKELAWLWHIAKVLRGHREEARGRPENNDRMEYSILLDGEGVNAKVRIGKRARGAPVDVLVGELMIFANMTWGGWLEDEGCAGIYRTQSRGKVKMTSVAGSHDGLGVPQYAWCTSPVRRYVDLVNQRQLIALAERKEAVYRASDSDLYSIIGSFTAVYSAYSDFQRKMERYWSLRYLIQENIRTIRAVVIKDDLLELEGMPFLQRIPGLPALEKGQVVVLNVCSVDFVNVVLDATLREVLDEKATDAPDEDEVVPEVVEAQTAQEVKNA